MKHLLLRGTLMLCALLLLFFSFNGCRRDLPESPTLPDVRERFQTAIGQLTTPEEINFFDFDYLSSANPNVVSIAAQRGDDTLTTALALRLLELNQIHHFSGNLISRYGYPLWDRSEILLDSSSNHPAVILPIAQPDETRTRAFIFAVPSAQGWGIWLHSAFKVDSLIQVVHTDSDNLAFKVAALLNSDVHIFRNDNLIYRAWLDSLSSVGSTGQVGENLQERCQWTSFTICPEQTGLTTISDRTEEIQRCYTTIICIGGAGFGGNIDVPNDGTGGSLGTTTQTFATFWSDCLDVMNSGIDPSSIDPAAVGGEISACQKLYAVHQNTLLLPYQLEYLKYRPTLLTAISNLLEVQGPTPSNLQMITSIFSYLEKGWMTDTQAEDILSDIPNKVPVMKKLIALTTTLNLTQGQFQWLLQKPSVVAQFDQFDSTNPNIPQADRNRLFQNLLDAYMTDSPFLQRNIAANFPNIGTETWAKTFRVAEPNAVEPEPNAQEVAFTINHPVAAALIYLNSGIALDEAERRWAGTGSPLTHDNADAFRHAFWMAINARIIGAPLALEFGVAHESDTPAALTLAKTMDLFNNNIGIDFGVFVRDNGNNRTNAQIADDIDQLRRDGTLRQLFPLDFPNHLDTEGIIPGVTQMLPTTPN